MLNQTKQTVTAEGNAPRTVVEQMIADRRAATTVRGKDRVLRSALAAVGRADYPWNNVDLMLRRLVRRLNDAGWRSGRAFYVNGGKFNCARLRRGELEIGMCQRAWQSADPDDHFDDGNGHAI